MWGKLVVNGRIKHLNIWRIQLHDGVIVLKKVNDLLWMSDQGHTQAMAICSLNPAFTEAEGVNPAGWCVSAAAQKRIKLQ